MDEGEGETDGEASELAVVVTAVGNAKDDHQEDEGQKGFNQESTAAADSLVVSIAGSSLEFGTITVRSENASSTSTGGLPDAEQDSASDDSANELGCPVDEHFFATHAAIGPNAKADSRIEVCT